MAKRIDKIKQKVEAEGEVFVSELSRLYNVTEETIRRYL
ncbi:MAG: DeoR family transcriptional regulator [Firmicutes bacterium]|nr:DeoR family transcriptional regulator [Bacillota bacterium]